MYTRAVQLSLVILLLVTGGVVHAQDGKSSPKVRLKLIDAGSEPRQVLRYRLSPGMEESVLMTMKMEMAMEVDGEKVPPGPAPTMEMVMDMKIDEVVEDRIKYEFVLSDAKVIMEDEDMVPAEALEAMEAQMQLLVGLRGEGVITNRGFTLDASIHLPENAPPAAVQIFKGIEKSLGELSSPLPEEPVGVGATWQIEQDISSNGMQMQQTVLQELKELNKEDFTTQSSVTQTAEPQRMDIPGFPEEDFEFHVDSLSGTGKGDSKIKFAGMVPHSKVEYESTLEMTTTTEDQTVETTLNTKMTMTLAPNK